MGNSSTEARRLEARALGVTVQQLAQVAGVHRTTVHRYLSGRIAASARIEAAIEELEACREALKNPKARAGALIDAARSVERRTAA